MCNYPTLRRDRQRSRPIRFKICLQSEQAGMAVPRIRRADIPSCRACSQLKTRAWNGIYQENNGTKRTTKPDAARADRGGKGDKR